MKLTKQKLKQIIKEEFDMILSEGDDYDVDCTKDFLPWEDQWDYNARQEYCAERGNTSPESIAISIPEVIPGATIQDEELDQEIEIMLTDNSGEEHLKTITLRQLVRAARGA